MKFPSCINCGQRKPGFLFEIIPYEDPDQYMDTAGRVHVCRDCVKDPVTQQAIVRALVESCS